MTNMRPSIAACLCASVMIAAPIATAECKDKLFTAKVGTLYLEAETALFTDEDPAASLDALLRLRKLRLNCYELKHSVQLTAAVYFRLERYMDAAKSLEEAIENELLSGEDLLRTYYQVAQIYLQEEELKKAKYYLDQWLKAGAQPNVQQYMQLAAVHNKLDDNWAAARFLEALLVIEPSPKKDVIDFVIFIYNETNQKTKLAGFLRNTVIPRFPNVKRYWEVVAGLYYEANQERNAFETVKAMYLAGLLTSQAEIMRVVNFYNLFNAPFEAGRILDAEIKAGHVEKTAPKLELLANLYQVSREYERAIPVLRDLARLSGAGTAYERLGRSYFELHQYDKAVKALAEAGKRNKNKNKNKKQGQLYGLVGRAHHQLDQRDAARAAFERAGVFTDGEKTAAAWLKFMDDEDITSHALKLYNANVARDELSNIKKSCDRAFMLGSAGGALPEECADIDTRLRTLTLRLTALKSQTPIRRQ